MQNRKILFTNMSVFVQIAAQSFNPELNHRAEDSYKHEES